MKNRYERFLAQREPLYVLAHREKAEVRYFLRNLQIIQRGSNPPLLDEEKRTHDHFLPENAVVRSLLRYF